MGTQDRTFILQSNSFQTSIADLRRKSANPIDKDENFSKEVKDEEFDSEIEEFSIQLDEI